jgi:hypothetical protein
MSSSKLVRKSITAKMASDDAAIYQDGVGSGESALYLLIIIPPTATPALLHADMSMAVLRAVVDGAIVKRASQVPWSTKSHATHS